MLINIALTILGGVGLISLESFFLTLFSLSVFIIVLLVLIDKWSWVKWLIFTVIITIILDVIFHRSIGSTLLVITISTVTLYLFFLIMPKKQVILSYIPYFFAILIFYILSDVLFPFLQENVWGVLTWTEVLGDVIKSFISVLLIFLSNTVIDNFRSNQDLQL
jgi:hypothetical protein